MTHRRQDTAVDARRPHALAASTAAALSIGAALAIDQLTKAWALQSLADGTIVELLPTLTLRLVFNPGAAFGFGADAGPLFAIALLGVAAALVVLLIVQVVRRAPVGQIVALSFATGGALGNLYDRIARATRGVLDGTVVDMIAIDWFAVFNVADIFITCGLAAWALLATRPSPPNAPTGEPQLHPSAAPTGVND